MKENCWRVNELAKDLGWSTDLVRSVFRNEPGVLHRQKPRAQYGPIKRSYDTMTIPEHVVERVKKRLRVQ